MAGDGITSERNTSEYLRTESCGTGTERWWTSLDQGPMITDSERIVYLLYDNRMSTGLIPTCDRHVVHPGVGRPVDWSPIPIRHSLVNDRPLSSIH